jgi:hypothetical protein
LLARRRGAGNRRWSERRLSYGEFKTTLKWHKETGNMKISLKYLSLWIPFIYAMAVSGIALWGWARTTAPSPAGLPAFIAFLPMAFFFSAIQSQNHLSRLEKRIEGLENQAGPRTNQVSN